LNITNQSGLFYVIAHFLVQTQPRKITTAPWGSADQPPRESQGKIAKS
jgi:hypothetical protein